MDKKEIIEEVLFNLNNNLSFTDVVLSDPKARKTFSLILVNQYLQDKENKTSDIIDGIIEGFRSSKYGDSLLETEIPELAENMLKRIADSVIFSDRQIEANSANLQKKYEVSSSVSPDSPSKAFHAPFSAEEIPPDILTEAHRIIEFVASPSSDPVYKLALLSKEHRHAPELKKLIQICESIFKKRITRGDKTMIPFTEKWLCKKDEDRIVFAKLTKLLLTSNASPSKRILAELKASSIHPVNRTLVELLKLKRNKTAVPSEKSLKDISPDELKKVLRKCIHSPNQLEGPIKKFLEKFYTKHFFPLLLKREFMKSNQSMQDYFFSELEKYIDEGNMPNKEIFKKNHDRQEISSEDKKKDLILKRLFKGGINDRLMIFIVNKFIKTSPFAKQGLSDAEIKKLRHMHIRNAEEAKNFLITVRQDHEDFLQGTLLWNEMDRFIASYDEPLIKKSAKCIQKAREITKERHMEYKGPSRRQMEKLIKTDQIKLAKDVLSLIEQLDFEKAGKLLTQKICKPTLPKNKLLKKIKEK